MQYLYAAEETTAADVAGPFVQSLKDAILYPLILLMMGVALLVFLWGVFRFIANAGSDEAREVGKRHMIYGIIGLVVMTSAYTILRIATATFGVPIPD